MKTAPVIYKQSLFRPLRRALTLGPAFVFILIMAWTAWQNHTLLKSELINQINDDVANLSEIYILDGPTAVEAAIDQRLQLSPLNRSGAHYLFKANGNMVPSGDLSKTLLNEIVLTETIDLTTADFGPLLLRGTAFKNNEILIVARKSNILSKALGKSVLQSLIGLIAIILLSYLLTQKFTQRLHRRIFQMNDTLITVGEGHLDTRLKNVAPEDELGFLTHQINIMIERAERLLTLRKRVTDQVAHEMRSPLTRLEATLETLELDNSEVIDKIRTDIRHSVEMLDGMLDISSTDAQQGDRRGLEEIALKPLIASIIELFDPVAEDDDKQINFMAYAAPKINAIPSQIGRLVSNLLDNAIKYSDLNTTIEVILSVEENMAVLRVSNYGPQIIGRTKIDIFTPFYRHPDMADRKGFGLGLALCRSIATRHEGHLDIEPSPSKTIFKLALPLA